jgi:hypothetical protein
LITENFLDRLEALALPADARGIDDRVLLPAAREVERDRIARRARLVEGDHALLAEDRVHERRLADVGAADDRHLDRARTLAIFGGRTGSSSSPAGNHVEHVLDELAHVLAVRRRDRDGVAQPELVELGDGAIRRKPFRLVDHEHHRTPRLAQEVGDHRVLRRETVAGIGDEDHDVALGDGLLRLPRHLVQDAGRRLGLEAAGVDDEVLAIAEARAAEVAIAREARKIGDERVARLRQPIEERRLAYIGSSNQRDCR